MYYSPNKMISSMKTFGIDDDLKLKEEQYNYNSELAPILLKNGKLIGKKGIDELETKEKFNNVNEDNIEIMEREEIINNERSLKEINHILTKPLSTLRASQKGILKGVIEK